MSGAGCGAKIQRSVFDRLLGEPCKRERFNLLRRHAKVIGLVDFCARKLLGNARRERGVVRATAAHQYARAIWRIALYMIGD